MSLYPVITPVSTPEKFKVDTRLFYDNEQFPIELYRSGGTVGVGDLRYLAEVIEGVYAYPDGAAGGGAPTTVPEALRILADDLDYAIAELTPPSP